MTILNNGPLYGTSQSVSQNVNPSLAQHHQASHINFSSAARHTKILQPCSKVHHVTQVGPPLFTLSFTSVLKPSVWLPLPHLFPLRNHSPSSIKLSSILLSFTLHESGSFPLWHTEWKNSWEIYHKVLFFWSGAAVLSCNCPIIFVAMVKAFFDLW